MRRGSTIKWDEEVIAEHDKLRGTRMKIEEPDTPFEPGDGMDGLEEDFGDALVQEEVRVGGGLEPVPVAQQAKKGGAAGGGGLDFSALEGKLGKVAKDAEQGKLFTGADKAESDREAKKRAFKVRPSGAALPLSGAPPTAGDPSLSHPNSPPSNPIRTSVQTTTTSSRR